MGGTGGGLDCGCCSDDDVGSSRLGSMSDRVSEVCEDKDSVDAVGDNVAVVGTIVSACKHGAKHPLEWG